MKLETLQKVLAVVHNKILHVDRQATDWRAERAHPGRFIFLPPEAVTDLEAVKVELKRQRRLVDKPRQARVPRKSPTPRKWVSWA